MGQDKPPFDEDAELFKLQVLADYRTSRYFAWLAIYTGLIIAYWVYLITYVHDPLTYNIALALGGITVIIAIVVMVALPYYGDIKQISEYIEQIKRKEPLQPLIELHTKGKWIRRWLDTRRDRSETDAKEGKKRGLGFFLVLAVGLWFTGFFAWSQTVIWQSAISDIHNTTGIANQLTVAFEAIGETLIISGLFGFYLWVAYTLSASFREVFDGLFGLRRRENGTTNPVT